jgi:hypothetical protein
MDGSSIDLISEPSEDLFPLALDALNSFQKHANEPTHIERAGEAAWVFCGITKKLHFKSSRAEISELASDSNVGETCENAIALMDEFDVAAEKLLANPYWNEIEKSVIDLLDSPELEFLMLRPKRVGGEENLAVLRILKTRRGCTDRRESM